MRGPSAHGAKFEDDLVATLSCKHDRKREHCARWIVKSVAWSQEDPRPRQKSLTVTIEPSALRSNVGAYVEISSRRHHAPVARFVSTSVNQYW
jgi:hypothetical protein